MKGAVIHGARDVRFEEVATPRIQEPTDALIRISAACVCGSDLWPYRGANPIPEPTPMGHEYCGVVEEVGKAVTSVRPGQFVIGSFFAWTTPARTARLGIRPRVSSGSWSAARRRRSCGSPSPM